MTEDLDGTRSQGADPVGEDGPAAPGRPDLVQLDGVHWSGPTPYGPDHDAAGGGAGWLLAPPPMSLSHAVRWDNHRRTYLPLH